MNVLRCSALPAAAAAWGPVVVLLLLASSVGCLSTQDATEPFIGWSGESYQPNKPQHPQQESSSSSSSSSSSQKKWVELVSYKPRVYIYHNFLTDEECSHIKKLAIPTLKRSTVVGTNGSSVLDDYRTSFGTFIHRRVDSTVADVERRLAEWVQIPEVHGEDLQVLRYGLGQQYKPHMDILSDDVAGKRVATILLYLNDVEEGGETAFPSSDNWIRPELAQRMGPFSPCAQGHVAFKPKKGDALMFWSVTTDGKQDMLSEHTGCPVIKGEKLTATKWVHEKPFRAETLGNSGPPDPDPGHCVDSHDMCETWASSGECTKNPGFMVGDIGHTGKCRLACKVCTECKVGDLACYNSNREKLGYLKIDPADKELADAVDWSPLTKQKS